MDLQLSTTGDMKKAIESIDSFTSYLSEQAIENPDKVYIFANKLIKDLKPLEKQTKDRAIHVQETYWELSGGYKLRVSVKRDYDYSFSQDWLIAKAQLEEIESILRLQIDLEDKQGGTDHKKNSVSYTLVTPK